MLVSSAVVVVVIVVTVVKIAVLGYRTEILAGMASILG